MHDKFKLLVAAKQNGASLTKVCTFGANSWTAIQDFPISCRSSRRKIGEWHSQLDSRGAWWVIISFDLAKETFDQVSQRHVTDDNLWKPVLQVFRNWLCASFDRKKTHWDMWLMKGYGVE